MSPISRCHSTVGVFLTALTRPLSPVTLRDYLCVPPSTKASTLLSMLQLVPHWLQLSDTSGQSLSLPRPDPRPEEEDYGTKAPYHEDCVVLPIRNTTRTDVKSIEREVEYRTQPDDMSLSKWSPASWLNLLLEKHAWLSAGLVWVPGAATSASRGVFDESRSDEPESRPTINLFEGPQSHLTRRIRCLI